MFHYVSTVIQMDFCYAARRSFVVAETGGAGSASASALLVHTGRWAHSGYMEDIDLYYI